MVPDTTGITHSGCGDNNLWCLVIIDVSGFLGSDQEIKSFKGYRIYTLHDKLSCGIIIAVRKILSKHMSCFNCQRAVYINRKIPVSRYKLILLYLPEQVQKLLSTSNRKCRHYHITAPVQGSLGYLYKIINVINALIMEPVSISGFHYHIIRIMNVLRVSDKRFIKITQISGEHYLLRNSVFIYQNLNGRRSQQMSGIYKPNLNSVPKLHNFIVVNTAKMLQYSIYIIEIIDRSHSVSPCSLTLTIFILSLLHLNMCRIPEHYVNQVFRCPCGNHRSVKAILVSIWNHTGMVDMGMCQKYVINIRIFHRQGSILIMLDPLLHAAVNHDL